MAERIEYHDGDTRLIGLFAQPSGQARAGVLVCHEGPGRMAHIERRIEQLAEQGYAAFAVDMFGDGAVPLGDQAATAARMNEWLGDRPAMRRRALAGLNALAARPGVAPDRLLAIGFCFGGSTVLELARGGAALLGVVSFHGALGTGLPAEKGAVRAKILSCTGINDPLIPSEDRVAFEKEMAAAEADWQTMLFSGTSHSFTNRDAPDRPGFGYNPWAEQQAWAAMNSFFDALLAG